MTKNRIQKPIHTCISSVCNKKVWKKGNRCRSCVYIFILEKRIKIECLQCGKIFEVKPYRKDTVKYCSNKCRIKGLSENNIGKIRPDISLRVSGKNNPVFGNPRNDLQIKFKGKGNPMYKDGRTSLTVMIRTLLEYKIWRKSILKRDNYTCLVCNQYSGHLEVHHKKPFLELLEEFLKHYDQFSPVEDKETLVRLAMKWKPFWDINNGETKCFNCHRYKKYSKDRK